ncbi:hypothetical protein TWF225_003103 [Orbilia oligospora]|uniref:Protein DGCR14 n=1 Tax=Orbilia oligospora TaxID=2813651 RepID=A0A8H2E3Z7_ORBOL|nr:hypothetical protein TWF225_003103 [Orbilia oligospora]KAF3233790.1 hypothetical protein TWF128_002898 [Orbilia oligospora]KAF3237495.1 hypothetical protein TWF217_002117 [Orbilia oligospora]KAF3288951.1 hypothetical protein TWF132_007822 [Orbilia oligospora]TGJ70388.1 hypothetical protein EYR41_006354 [Orbilia oligospora]
MADYSSSTTQSQALVRRSTDTQLMPPPPAKRIKRPPKVLDEDSYTTAISDIIARDFFPGLTEAKHQEEYLDALASNDKEWIASAGRKLSEVMTGSRVKHRHSTPSLRSMAVDATPSARGFDTPMSTRDDMSITSASSSNPMQKTYEDKLSLDNFQSKYTSEDNASFNDLLDDQNQKRRDEYGWLWRGNQISKPSVIAERERQKLLKEKEEREGVDKTKLLEYQDKPAMPETWKVNPRNGFMFTPANLDDAMLDPDLNPATNTESRAAPKSISHANTRMPPPKEAHSVPPSPSVSAIQAAISGRPRYSASDSSVAGGSETPRVNGYSFVDDAPSPSPSELGLPPMTWGTVDDLLPSVEASPSPFKINEQPKRERTLHRMVDKVAKSKRASAKMMIPGTPGGSVAGTPVGTARRLRTLGNMTPAAKGLLGKIGTGRSDSVFGGTGGKDKTDLRYRWAPTPRADRKADATPLIKRK